MPGDTRSVKAGLRALGTLTLKFKLSQFGVNRFQIA